MGKLLTQPLFKNAHRGERKTFPFVNAPHPLYRLRKVWQRRQCSVKGGMLTISHATVSIRPMFSHTHTDTNTLTSKSDCADQRENIMRGGCVGLSQSGGWSRIDINGLSWQLLLLFFSPLPPRPAAPR